MVAVSWRGGAGASVVEPLWRVCECPEPCWRVFECVEPCWHVGSSWHMCHWHQSSVSVCSVAGYCVAPLEALVGVVVPPCVWTRQKPWSNSAAWPVVTRRRNLALVHIIPFGAKCHGSCSVLLKTGNLRRRELGLDPRIELPCAERQLLKACSFESQ
ncbi:hypothetical protein INR49_000233, partial [Caranx melampygus]